MQRTLLSPCSALFLLLPSIACATAGPPAAGSPAAAQVPAPAGAAPAPPAVSLEVPAGNALLVTNAPDVPAGADAARDAELAAQVTPLLDVYVDRDALFTPDGRSVVYLSNRDGLPQLYLAEVAHPELPPRRLTSTGERVGTFAVAPDGKAVVFCSDKGADENWSLFRVGLDGQGLVELTAGETLNREDLVMPIKAGGSLFYTARKMSEGASGLWALAPGDTPRRLYGSPGTAGVGDISPDGKRAAWLRFPSQTEQTLELVDLATGKAQVLYPKSGQAKVTAVAFAADGQTLFLATDRGAEQALLLALDVKTGKEKARYVETEPRTATLDGLLASPRGDRVALQLNAGNQNRLRLLDARTLKPAAAIALPLGSGGLGGFSRDGKRLTATWSTPASPPEIWSIDVASGAVTPLRTEPRPGLAGLPALDVRSVELRAFDGLTLPVNVYLPAGAEAAGKKLPVIASYHGGPAGSSQIRWSAAVRFFLALGYAWVEPNVRGSDGFGRAYEMADNGPKRLDAFKDVEAVGRWAAAQPWADPERLVIYGGSYGGYTVLVGMTRMPGLWRAGVDLFGVADLRTFLSTTSGVIREIFKLEFGELEKDGPFLDSISPLRDADKIVRPLFVYAGANDPRVPRTESDQVAVALRKRGVPVEYMVAADEGHSLSRRATQIAFFSRAARFLEKTLR